MWSWEIVFIRISTEETITIVGTNYPTKKVAEWMRSEWLKDFLPSFFMFKLVRSEVKLCGHGK